MKYQMSDWEDELNCSSGEIDHDCHLSEEDGCEVCDNKIRRTK